MPKTFTNADLEGWYGFHRSGTVLFAAPNRGAILATRPGTMSAPDPIVTMQTVAAVGFTHFDGGSGKYGAPDGVGYWHTIQITTKLDIQNLTGQTLTGPTTELDLPIENDKFSEPDPQYGFYQVSPDGTFKMWISDKPNDPTNFNGPVAAWGVLVNDDEYYALSMLANTAVTVIGKKTPR